MTRKKSRFLCHDCRVDTSAIYEYYMVHDAVWGEAGNIKGMLCIGCLEQRLGRKLSADDFTDAPVNFIFDYSPRLLTRIGRKYST